MLKDLKPRIYQETILATCSTNNTLVVLPTGLGKTAVAMMLSILRLKQHPNSKILMLAPTKPLCEQHQRSFQKHLEIDDEKIICFTGNVKPSIREEQWKTATIIISTPQGLENDLINERISFTDVSLLVFDEAHHATGDYSYVWLAKQYLKFASNTRILALTASPGSELEKIKEVCSNLFIEEIEVRSDTDTDVKPYMQITDNNFVLLDFPVQFKALHSMLNECYKSKLKSIKKLGYCNKTELNKSQVLRLQRELQRELGKDRANFEVMKSLSLVAEALKIEHALGLLECQGVTACCDYLTELQLQSGKSKVKAVKNLVRDVNFKSALHSAQRLVEEGVVHPKLPKMVELVQSEIVKNSNVKMLLFSQFRDTATQIVDTLQGQGVHAQVFVGQAKKKGLGMTQKVQRQVLDQFRNGKFPVLVATSVAEEGLDIPRVNKVIFYEPTPSAIRSIQRRGRTGRSEKGEVTVLVTRGTRDEAYRWAAHHKEKRMYRYLDDLKRMKGKLVVDLHVKEKIEPKKKNATLTSFVNSEKEIVTIVCDHREKGNIVVKSLMEMGISVRLAQLKLADYIVGGKVAVELKKVDDFVGSLLDGRLLSQVKELRDLFEKSVLIVEGEEDIYSVRKVHPNAIRGALASIAIGFGVPVLYTKNSNDTSALLAVMAKREQQAKNKVVSSHSSKPSSLRASQEFIVESFPSIGPSVAKALLEHFGSIEKIVLASEEELLLVAGVGKTIALRLREVLVKSYDKK
tara:strand:- start:3651 stop:5888 length:2238 start_codon:yes stop_codon:yes gene_type:complete